MAGEYGPRVTAEWRTIVTLGCFGCEDALKRLEAPMGPLEATLGLNFDIPTSVNTTVTTPSGEGAYEALTIGGNCARPNNVCEHLGRITQLEAQLRDRGMTDFVRRQ